MVVGSCFDVPRGGPTRSLPYLIVIMILAREECFSVRLRVRLGHCGVHISRPLAIPVHYCTILTKK